MTGNLVVIGAGVIGATMAAEAARRGWSTTVLDAAPDVGGGCSYANAALVAPSHVGPLATPALLRDAIRQLWRKPSAVRIHPDPSVVPWLVRLAASAWRPEAAAAVAQLRVAATESGAQHARWHEEGRSSGYRRIGALDVRLRPGGPGGSLTPTQLRALEPSLGVVASGVHHPGEAITEPRGYIREMLAQARESGARVEFGRTVSGLEVHRNRVTGVQVAGGVVPADHVVVCTGLARGLAAQVGLRLPLRGGRGYVIDLAPSPDTPRMAVRLVEHRVVVTPLADRVRVAGSIEFGAEHRPWDTVKARQLVQAAARGIPALAGRPVLDLWAGERPCTSDGIPVVGSTRQVGGLSFAVGHGMWGLVLAPHTAGLVLDDIDAPTDLGLFAPDRFAQRSRRSLSSAPASPR